jgi:hypothetical protein
MSLNFSLQKRHRDRPSAMQYNEADFRDNTQAISIFIEKCQRYLHEGRPELISPWDIFLFLEKGREKKITIIFTLSSLEVLLHLIQTCSHGDPHRTFKVNPIAARRCLGVRVCSSVCDCKQSEQRAGDDVCVCVRARGARGEWGEVGARGAAHSRAPRPLGRGGR